MEKVLSISKNGCPFCFFVFIFVENANWLCEQEYQLTQKDKGSLRSVWQRFLHSSKAYSDTERQSVFREREVRELEMSSCSLLADEEDS